ncbi:hypothetical protein C8J56DRAFT_1129618 [Mycena floridula]|nr:hypothetical protein C8J56DRAFT_1129618 [Mycena floridula]
MTHMTIVECSARKNASSLVNRLRHRRFRTRPTSRTPIIPTPRYTLLETYNFVPWGQAGSIDELVWILIHDIPLSNTVFHYFGACIAHHGFCRRGGSGDDIRLTVAQLELVARVTDESYGLLVARPGIPHTTLPIPHRKKTRRRHSLSQPPLSPCPASPGPSAPPFSRSDVTTLHFRGSAANEVSLIMTGGILGATIELGGMGGMGGQADYPSSSPFRLRSPVRRLAVRGYSRWDNVEVENLAAIQSYYVRFVIPSWDVELTTFVCWVIEFAGVEALMAQTWAILWEEF